MQYIACIIVSRGHLSKLSVTLQGHSDNVLYIFILKHGIQLREGLGL